MALKDWKFQWKRGYAKRYWGNKVGHELQIGKYRGADDFDKYMNNNYEWHGKWYVDFINTGRKVKLFKTKSEAQNYAKKYMKKY